MKKQIYLLFIFVLALQAFAQKKTRADKYFEKGDFLMAASLYEKDLQKEDKQRWIQQTAICYYNTFQYKEAGMYLKKIVNGNFKEPDKSYDNKYNFMYYQVLSALNDFENAIKYLKLYHDGLEKPFDKNATIEKIEEFRLRSEVFGIKKAKINSEASDFGALKKNDTVYFTSDRGSSSTKYKWTHRSFLDIYAAIPQDTSYQIKKLEAPINTKLHEGNFCFSKDGNTLYFSRSNITKGKKQFDRKKTNNVHLYTTSFKNGKWSEPVKMPFNKIGYSYQHPALSPDGKKLYFSSNQEGGLGGFDLYVVDVENPTADPINLGDKINTPNRDQFPYIDALGNLFFASDGHLGLGMLDVFACEFKNNDFSEPINVGAPINSAFDDFSLAYYSKTEGFFTTNRKNVNDDVYQFVQIGDIFEKEYIVSFEVRDKETNELIPNAKATLKNRKGEDIYQNTLDQNGTFNLTLGTGRYQFRAEQEHYLSNEMVVVLKKEHNQKWVLLLTKKAVEQELPTEDEVEMKKDPVAFAEKKKAVRSEMLTDKNGPPIVEKNGKMYFELEPIYFDYDKWNIRADSKKILDALAEKLEKYPSIHLKITSHTDNRGTEVYNQILSEKRAQSTRSYLALEGYVHARRLQFSGMGEQQPKVDCKENCTEEQHQLNRRSEFEIVKY